jgi:hypothetical protein
MLKGWRLRQLFAVAPGDDKCNREETSQRAVLLLRRQQLRVMGETVRPLWGLK